MTSGAEGVHDNGSTRFYRTAKVGTGLVRTEIEEETTRAVFDRTWPLTKGKPRCSTPSAPRH
jgi:hypothetical protein